MSGMLVRQPGDAAGVNRVGSLGTAGSVEGGAGFSTAPHASDPSGVPAA